MLFWGSVRSGVGLLALSVAKRKVVVERGGGCG